MLQSMTGFATSIIEVILNDQEKLSLTIQIKSLNSRFFEASCKIPHLFSNLEIAIQKLLKQKLERGHIYISLKIQQESLHQFIAPSLPTIKSYVKSIKIIKEECGITENISLNTLLQLPHIFQTEENTLNKASEHLFLEKIECVIQQLIDMRLNEGLILEKDLRQQIYIINQKLEQIKNNSYLTAQKKRKELDQCIIQLQQFLPETISSEKVFLESQKNTIVSDLEKININEEIVRAQAHLHSMDELLTKNEFSKGKKLDFILQEVNREINTITAKCSDFFISSLAIDIKSELEKSREQVQNVV
ncbi:DUF1732 domain-containing protein [Candidatus Dependentiae bacterium]|nr:DUF1732 domain-containing protein [Candidatus Dependentiae bacterium]